ncbi:MAG: GtrA family protein [Candidatus Nomurabacteria bacterium]|nr:MAG: GtrA family protein [Candidatus Nomurabacteria bacterium]
MQQLVNYIRQHPFIERRPGLAQFIKFGVVGFGNTCLDFSIYFSLTRFFHVPFLAANAVAFLSAVSLSFTLNKRWTFRDRQRAFRRQYTRFVAVSAVGAVLTELGLWFFVVVVGLHDIYAKIVSVLIVLFWNFFANKFWTFRQH